MYYVKYMINDFTGDLNERMDYSYRLYIVEKFNTLDEALEFCERQMLAEAIIEDHSL